MYASGLEEEKVALLKRLKEIDVALLKYIILPVRTVDEASPVGIRTHRNLRNTGLPVTVYSDKSLRQAQPGHHYGGWITAEDADSLRVGHFVLYEYERVTPEERRDK